MKLELQLPQNLQVALNERAQAHARSAEDEARLLLETALEAALETTGLISEAEQLTVLDDAQLWRVAAQKVSLGESERMQTLIERYKTEGLPSKELAELGRFQKYAERVTLLRAEAAALLKRRGHDPTRLLQS